MGVGVEQQKQPFHLFSEGLDASEGLSTAGISFILTGTWWEWGSKNNRNLIYFKKVWMRVGVKQQQQFYVFKEGREGQQQPLYLLKRDWIVVWV